LTSYRGTAGKKVNLKGEGLSNIRDLARWCGVAEDADSGFAFLRSFPDVRGDRLGLIGFCWDSEMTFASATQAGGSKLRWFFTAGVQSLSICLKTSKRRCWRITAKKIQMLIRVFQPRKKQ
jgi:hypothetical protein